MRNNIEKLFIKVFGEWCRKCGFSFEKCICNIKINDIQIQKSTAKFYEDTSFNYM